jgi:hypothetical protein
MTVHEALQKYLQAFDVMPPMMLASPDNEKFVQAIKTALERGRPFTDCKDFLEAQGENAPEGVEGVDFIY